MSKSRVCSFSLALQRWSRMSLQKVRIVYSHLISPLSHSIKGYFNPIPQEEKYDRGKHGVERVHDLN